MEPDSRRIINVLQAGRAIAAFMVLLHHAGPWVARLGGHFHGLGIFGRGFAGVDFFFVLSGFIIYHSTVEKKRTLMDYARARFRRVMLPYLPIGVLAALIYTAFPAYPYEADRWGWLATLTLLPVQPAPALTVAWTLQHEMLFYFIFGLCYFSGYMWLGLAVWTAAILLGPSGNIPLASINLEFLMGIAVCLLYRRGKGHWLLLLVSAALLICWVLLGAREEQRLIVGFACACLTLQLSLMERRGRITVPAWLVFMGSASYALYLTHELVLPAAARLAGHSRILNFAVCVVACLSAAVAYYWWIERRLIARKSASRVTPPTTRAVSGQK